jgi:hypothetical protein
MVSVKAAVNRLLTVLQLRAVIGVQKYVKIVDLVHVMDHARF